MSDNKEIVLDRVCNNVDLRRKARTLDTIYELVKELEEHNIDLAADAFEQGDSDAYQVAMLNAFVYQRIRFNIEVLLEGDVWYERD